MMSEKANCRFTFDDSPEFEGYADGSTWNGFDNVAVTPEVFEKIKEWAEREGCAEEFSELRPTPNGMISFAYGFTTTKVGEV